jgi:hypothetical protein
MNFRDIMKRNQWNSLPLHNLKWVGHTLKKNASAIEKHALSWNLQDSIEGGQSHTGGEQRWGLK